MRCLLLLGLLSVSFDARAQQPAALPTPLETALEAELDRLGHHVADDAWPSVAAPFRSTTDNPGGIQVALVDPVLVAETQRAVRRPNALARDVALLLESLTLSTETLTLVVHPDWATVPPPRRADLAQTLGVARVDIVPATNAAAIASAVPEGAIVYVDAGTGLSDTALRDVAKNLTERGTPTLAATPTLVRHGFLASASPDFEEVLARHLALTLADAARSDSLAPTAFTAPRPLPARLTINAATASDLGLVFPWDVLLQANVLGEAAATAAPLGFDDAVQIAARDNAALRAEVYRAEAAEAAVALARSRVLPQVRLSSTARLVNEDLATSALGGAVPERLWTAEAEVFQVLFSEPAFAGIAAQRRFAVAARYERESVRLDAASNGALAFLGVLRAQTGAAIAEERVARTQVDLDAARSRSDAGMASAGDVARLQAEVARARQDLVLAWGGVEVAGLALNQTLDLPIDAPVQVAVEGTGRAQAGEGEGAVLLASAATMPTADAPTPDAQRAVSDALATPRSLLAQIPILSLVDAPAATREFAAQAEANALADAPAAQALQAVVTARQRQLTSAQRSLYLPELSLFASASTRLADGGAGLTIPQGLPVPPAPDETWAVGVQLSFDLFSGGRKNAQRRLAEAEVFQAQAQLDLVQQQLALGARAAATQLGTTHAAYRQAEDAARAAAEAYEDVARLYREGVVGVTALVEAQEGLRITQELAANAAYDVAEAYVDLQRATGRFDALDRLDVADPSSDALTARRP
ncbi:MAG: TolC family protein [Bacteroidota bacterium]